MEQYPNTLVIWVWKRIILFDPISVKKLNFKFMKNGRSNSTQQIEKKIN